jgi:hypothetical protein
MPDSGQSVAAATEAEAAEAVVAASAAVTVGGGASCAADAVDGRGPLGVGSAGHRALFYGMWAGWRAAASTWPFSWRAKGCMTVAA